MPMSPRSLLIWAVVAIVIAAIITLLLQKLLNLVENTLPTWTLFEAQKRFARTFPNKDIYEIASYMIRRDRTFSWLVNFLPYQCLFALFMLATLWAFVIPKDSRFWLPLVQNIFIFEFMILALYPAFRLLQRMQRLTINRLQELLRHQQRQNH